MAILRCCGKQLDIKYAQKIQFIMITFFALNSSCEKMTIAKVIEWNILNDIFYRYSRFAYTYIIYVCMYKYYDNSYEQK